MNDVDDGEKGSVEGEVVRRDIDVCVRVCGRVGKKRGRDEM